MLSDLCCDISKELTCIQKVQKLRFPSCRWRNSSSRARTSSLSRPLTKSAVHSGTRLRCMRLFLHTASPETSFALSVSEGALSTALRIIVFISKPSIQSLTLRQTRLRHMSKIPIASMLLPSTLIMCVSFHSPRV